MKKFRPILFSTPMVQAILEGRKTQTRRTKGLEHINENPDGYRYDGSLEESPNGDIIKKENHFMEIIDIDGNPKEKYIKIKCPYGNIGDVLWVRETYCKLYESLDLYYFKDDKSFDHKKAKWKPSIHMPKAACRLFLRIKDVRVERLQDITNEDALAEGVKEIEKDEAYFDYMKGAGTYVRPIGSFFSLWRSINGEKSYDANPWVWVIEFERIEKPIDFK